MKYTVKIENRTFEVEINDLTARPVVATVDGVAIEVWPVCDDAPRPAAAAAPRRAEARPATPPAAPKTAARSGGAPAGNGSGSGSKTVLAPIPGVIVAVNVQPGSQVAVGDELCILEAMKMKNVIRASRAGEIATVSVKLNQHVKHHDVLFEYTE